MRYLHRLALGSLLAIAPAACTVDREQPNLVGQDVRLTFIHTADIHSRIFPYDYTPTRFDQEDGLLPGHAPFGGIARIGAIIDDVRANSSRSIWLDSGDWCQGAPVFNLFQGEAEFRAMAMLGLQGAVVGNHEFDLGSNNLYYNVISWGGPPYMAANYLFADPREPTAPKLAEIIQPYQLYDIDGVKVGVVGMAAEESMLSLYEGGNSLGVRPLNNDEIAQQYVSLLRPVSDVVVVLSHMGLDQDEGLTSAEVGDANEDLPLEGVDLILGGHLHIVLRPPKVLNYDEYGHPTVLVHSGAFARYVGRFDAVVRIGEDNSDPAKRSYITGFSYDNLPVSCGARANPSDPCPNPVNLAVSDMLQPYLFQLNEQINLDGVFAYINIGEETKITRNDTSGGDSQLGNLVARAMQRRQGVDAEFAITNSLGIRADFEPGALDVEQLYNVFPFENTITVIYLSGTEVQETLDFVSRKSSERGCRTQAQVAGISFTMVCGANPRAADVYLGEGCRKDDGSIDTTRCKALEPAGLYRVAVNDYIAAGGSGFTVLKRNTSKQNTGISLRAALMDYLRTLPVCADTVLEDTGLGDTEPVNAKYGQISCIDDQLEKHDGRILPRME